MFSVITSPLAPVLCVVPCRSAVYTMIKRKISTKILVESMSIPLLLCRSLINTWWMPSVWWGLLLSSRPILTMHTITSQSWFRKIAIDHIKKSWWRISLIHSLSASSWTAWASSSHSGTCSNFGHFINQVRPQLNIRPKAVAFETVLIMRHWFPKDNGPVLIAC